MRGVITRVFLNKGFAFLRGDDGVSRFVHCRAFLDAGAFDTLREGQEVTFTPTKADNGKGNEERASEVELA